VSNLLYSLLSYYTLLTRWPSCCPTLTPNSNPNPNPNQVAIVLSKTLLLFTTEEVSKQSILAASLLFVKVSPKVTTKCVRHKSYKYKKEVQRRKVTKV
jgi:hypothetical protein